MALELQRPAVLGDRPDDLIGHAVGNLCLNLNGYFDPGPDQSCDVLDDFFGYAAGVPADARRVKRSGAVEPPGRLLGSGGCLDADFRPGRHACGTDGRTGSFARWRLSNPGG